MNVHPSGPTKLSRKPISLGICYPDLFSFKSYALTSSDEVWSKKMKKHILHNTSAAFPKKHITQTGEEKRHKLKTNDLQTCLYDQLSCILCVSIYMFQIISYYMTKSLGYVIFVIGKCPTKTVFLWPTCRTAKTPRVLRCFPRPLRPCAASQQSRRASFAWAICASCVGAAPASNLIHKIADMKSIASSLTFRVVYACIRDLKWFSLRRPSRKFHIKNPAKLFSPKKISWFIEPAWPSRVASSFASIFEDPAMTMQCLTIPTEAASWKWQPAYIQWNDTWFLK